MSIDATYGNQISEIENLAEYIQEYAEQHGIDPTTFLSSLDGNLTADLQNDPAFQAYWEWTAMHLNYILSGGGVVYSPVPGDVNYDEDELRASYENADQEMLDLIEAIMNDNPEIMAFFLMQTEGMEEGNDLMALISAQLGSSTGDNPSNQSTTLPEFVNEEARELMLQYGATELESMISQTEMLNGAMQSLFMQIAEEDQMFAQMLEQMKANGASVDEQNAASKQYYQSREMKLLMVQNLQDALSTLHELYSRLYETQAQALNVVANNLRPA